MTASTVSIMRDFFRALGNESRLKLVGLLAVHERSGQELAALLELKEPTVSHHLAVLHTLGLLRRRADGNTHFWSLDVEAFVGLNGRLASRADIAALADDVALDAWDRRVLDNFLGTDGRLKEIPASRKKRWVVLRFLVERFAPDRRYAEAEVNEILKRYHEDSATLRREMIGYRMMARDHGVYWRLPKDGWMPA